VVEVEKREKLMDRDYVTDKTYLSAKYGPE
jgi:hypothetical protein